MILISDNKKLFIGREFVYDLVKFYPSSYAHIEIKKRFFSKTNKRYYKFAVWFERNVENTFYNIVDNIELEIMNIQC